MKTIQKDDQIKRIKNEEADKWIKLGWKYVPKKVYKDQFIEDEPMVSEKKTKKKKDK